MLSARAVILLTVIACASADSDDWLLQTGPAAPSSLTPWSSNALSGYILSNGLVTRTFVTSASGVPVWATFDITSQLDMTPASLLRALAPEAVLGCTGDCSSRPMPMPTNSFTRIATDSAAVSGDCAFVSQGDSSSLAACETSCWAAACNLFNFATSGAPDCVLRHCSNATNPALSPYPGFDVYATTVPIAQATGTVGGLVASPALGRSVTTGAYFNR